MGKDPMITVVLPVWRGRNFIDETIQSILMQTFTDWEMLIMGEPDSDNDVKRISRDYDEKYPQIHYVENDIRLGLAATLNKGIELARGKYIARVDVDDPSFPSRFEKQVEYMEAHDDVAICGTQQQFNVYPTSFFQITKFPLESDDIATHMLFYCCNGHSSLFLRRAMFIEKNWRYPTDKVQEDFALWMSLATEAKFANLDEVLVTHRIGMSDNLTSIYAEKMAASSGSLVSEFYNKYFGIDLGKYKTRLYVNRYGHSKKLIDIDDFATWIVEMYELFTNMERNNKDFNKTALSRTLRKQWNWMMDRYFCYDSWTNIHNINLPSLPDEYAGGFADAFEKTLQAEHDDIAELLHAEADSFARFIKTGIVRDDLNAVIFGVGTACDSFFNEVENWSELFNLIAFCDNDQKKQGEIKNGKKILSKNDLMFMDFDYIFISSSFYYSEIHAQLREMEISPDKILPLRLLKLYKK